jgi:hypothetical protein
MMNANMMNGLIASCGKVHSFHRNRATGVVTVEGEYMTRKLPDYQPAKSHTANFTPEALAQWKRAMEITDEQYEGFGVTYIKNFV